MFRIKFLFGAVSIVALFIVVRLYDIQIVSGQENRDKADRQYVHISNTFFDRGSIFFQTKDGENVTAAGLKSGFTVIIDPEKMTDPVNTYEKISAHLSISRDQFLSQALKVNDNYEEIARRTSEEIANNIKALAISGLDIARERWRFYPAQTLASHVIGFVAYDGDLQVGRYGLERQYEYVLNRSPKNSNINFFAEIFSNLKDSFVGPGKYEGNITTTIEPVVQKYAETAINDLQEEWQADSVGVIIMHPKTGEIYAMGASPNFDPNEFNLVRNQKLFSNPLVENVYEMGSIIKPLTIATGIDSGAITPNTTYYDAGFLVLNTARIQNYDGKGRGTVDMQVVLSKSLNTGVAFVANKVGRETFSTYFKALLEKRTGIDLPGETANLISNLDSNRDIEHATASYGQGIALTPISTVRALASLGNGGVLVTPHIVKKIQYESGLSETLRYDDKPRVFSENTSEEITRMLVRVVDEALLEGKVKMDQYSIAAKTGTAQIANPAGGGYYSDRYLHSFFGYFPAYDPEFLVFLYMVYPKNIQYASETLTLPFMDITKFLINYYGVLPDREKNEI